MTSRTPKPIKECEGCALNQGERCAVFAHPAMQWSHRECEGYNNPELVARYGEHGDGHGAYARKEARKLDAKKNSQNEHPEDHGKFKKIKFP